MRNNVHGGGDSLLSPALFAKTEKRTGGPAKGVPLFVCSKTKRAKKAAALALSVSLWIASGSVAGATDISASTTIDGGNGGDYNLTGNGITFTVNGGTVGNINIPGAISGNGNTIVIDGATVTGYLDGAYITDGNATGNTVHVKNGSTVQGIIHGGWGNWDANADGNTVLIEDSTLNNTVCGGRRSVDNTINTHANNNHVTIRNSYARSVIGGSNNYVYDDYAKVGTGNTVTLEGANVQAVVVGSGDSGGLEVGRGKKEYIGEDIYVGLVVTGLNVVRGEISNTNTIRFLPSVTWEPDKAVLVFSGNMNGGTPTLDISQANFSSATQGKMYLLYGTHQANAFDAMTVKYGSGDGDQTTFNGEGGVTSFVIPNVGGFQSETENGVTLDVNTVHMLALENNKKNLTRAALVYRVQGNVSRVAFGEMAWDTPRDASAEKYNYAGLTAAKIDASGLSFKNPETIAAGSTTLLEANNTLADFSAQTKNLSYENYSPVPGVTLNGQILGSYAAKDGKITYTATENKANNLTFGDVEWKDSGALMTRPANITFAGADVDTTNINFTNIQSLEANKKMTLVSDFGNSVGTITGAKYKVGSTLEGTGKASLVGSDLIFTAETGTGGKPDVGPQEQTHNSFIRYALAA